MYKNSAEKLREMVTICIGIHCLVIVVIAFFFFTGAVHDAGVLGGFLVVILAGAALFILWASNLFFIALLDMMIDVRAIRGLLEQDGVSGNGHNKTLSGQKADDGKGLSELPATNNVALRTDIPMSQEAKQILINAQKIAQKRHHPWEVPEHLLYALLESDTKKIQGLTAKLGVAPEEHIFLAILGCPSEGIKRMMSDFRFSKEGIFEIISKENS